MSAAVDTKERILAAATELFAERGYAATTTRAIAERAEVNEVTLFRHFENKLGILRALGERWNAQSPARIVGALPDPQDTCATLKAIALNEVRSSVENGGVALRIAFDAVSVPELAELMGSEGPGQNLEALAGYMADRQAAGDLRADLEPEVLAEAFSSLTSAYVMYRMVMGVAGKPDAEQIDKTVEQLFDLFWSGAAARKD